MPAIEGNAELIEASSDMRAFADKVEELRKKEKDVEAIVNTASPELTAERFYQAYSPALLNEDGSLNQEKVKEFYTQLKRIFDTGNYPEEKIENVVYTIGSMGVGTWDGIDMDSMEVVGGNLKVAAGSLGSVSGSTRCLQLRRR